MKNKYNLSGICIARTPIYSIDKDPKDISFSTFKEAIRYASSDLYYQIQKCEDWSSLQTLPDSIKGATLRYFNRMCNRCTPFGMFSAVSICSVVEHDSETKLLIDSHLHTHTNLDFYYIYSVFSCFMRREDFVVNCDYHINPTFIDVIDEFRYINASLKNKEVSFTVETVEKNDILLSLQDFCGLKQRSYSDLLNLILSAGYEKAEAKGFLSLLISERILIPSISPSTTQEDYLYQLIKFCSDKHCCEDLKNGLKDITTQCHLFDDKKIGLHKCINTVSNILRAVFNIHLTNSQLLKIDSERIGALSINKNALDSVLKATRLLNYNSNTHTQSLQQFASVFSEKFGENLVPLLVALDPDLGISYPVSKPKISKGTIFGSPDFFDSVQPQIVFGLNDLETYIFESMIKHPNETKIDVTDFINSAIKSNEHNQHISDSFSVFGEFIKDESNNGVQLILKSITDGCLLNTSARFMYFSPDKEAIFQDIARSEVSDISSEDITAEICHLPSIKSGNISLKKSLRDIEIAIYHPFSEKKKTIPVSDLYIKVVYDKIILFSKSLQKPIVPILTNAHNYRNSDIPVYEFLSDLRFQNGVRGYTFSYNNFFERFFDHLPRIEYENIVLHPEEWILLNRDLKELKDILGSQNFFEGIYDWRAKKHIPQKVLLRQTDQEILVDFQDEESVKSLLHTCRHLKKARLIDSSFIYKSIGVDEHMLPYRTELILYLQTKDGHRRNL